MKEARRRLVASEPRNRMWCERCSRCANLETSTESELRRSANLTRLNTSEIMLTFELFDAERQDLCSLFEHAQRPLARLIDRVEGSLVLQRVQDAGQAS